MRHCGAWRVALIALVAAVGVVVHFYQRDLSAARVRVAQGSEMARTPCGKIEYALFGTGSPVLVIHGAGGGIDQGRLLGQPLAVRGYRIIAMSRFGYLRTPLPADPSPVAQADAHACLLDTLGVREVSVVGVSAGAPSALQLALRHPKRVRALVLMVPGLWRPPSDRQPVSDPTARHMTAVLDTALRSDFLFWASIRVAPGRLTRSVLGTNPALVDRAPEPEQLRLAAMLDQILPISSRRAGLMNEFKVMSGLEPYPVARITVPTLAISARDDYYRTYEPARHLAQTIPGARFLAFENGGHMLVGHEAETMDAIAGFLRSATSRRPIRSRGDVVP